MAKGKGNKGKGNAGDGSMKVKKMPRLSAMQLSFSPNVEVSQRPVIALTTAVLCNVAPDLKLVSDHKRKSPTFGEPASGGEIVGDLPIARYLSRTSSAQFDLLSCDNASDMARIEQWVDYANSMSRLPVEQKLRAVMATLDHNLIYSTYLVNCQITMADLAIFMVLGWPAEGKTLHDILSNVASTRPSYRYVNTMAAHPAVREATQLALGVANNYEADFGGEEDVKPMSPLIAGMNPLEGAISGSVCTRFPPEPSGYLHIGHAKAVLLNDYYAKRYNGKLIVRFDDTNPSKEKEEYQLSIMQDLKYKLQIHPHAVFTFTSDYFKVIQGYAEYLIDQGLAYMDDTPQAEMQQQRMDRVESKHRNQSITDCQSLFKLMCSGDEKGSNYCLRVKMDMNSDNGTLRDPVIYRQNNIPHHRTGTTFHAYPTYDLACPIVDSLEGVTHALRTTEYNDRDEQYAWIQRLLKLRRVRIHAFARMNFQFTELSKRKLAWFVDNQMVTGWDDARFPTIRGVIRRGVHVEALRNFICGQGASRRITNMEWNKFWAENKKEIDKTAKRFMAISQSDHVTLTVENGPENDDNCFRLTDYLPKDPSFGKRVIRLGKQVILEATDVEGLEVNEEIVLMRWGVVKITQVTPNIVGTFVPDGDVKAAKRKITWLATHSSNTPCVLTEFDNLLSKAKLEPGDDFKDHLNPHTLATSKVIGDAGLKTLQKDSIIQLERRGYYRVDQSYISESKPLVLYMVPDGKAKAMSGLVGKLAHR